MPVIVQIDWDLRFNPIRMRCVVCSRLQGEEAEYGGRGALGMGINDDDDL